jgi:hypothetical protein
VASLGDVPISFTDPVWLKGTILDLPYHVDLWDDADSHVEELNVFAGGASGV